MEQAIDVEKKHLNRLRELLNIHLTNKTVWAYGSRVKWKADKVSDLDLVVMDAEYSQVVNARDAFSESNLPFTVQLLSWEGIPDNFKENIRKKYVVLQEGNGIPEGWREVKVGEICEIIGGGTPRTSIPEYWDGDIPWITPKDLSNLSNRYISKGSRNISQVGLESSSAKLLPEGAVLLSTRAPVGYLAIAENEVCTNQGFRNLIVNEDNDNMFLYYLLKRNVEYLKSQSAGTTFGELAGYTLKNLSFLLPPLQEQKAIAEILSSLDDKIDLLRRQNETLETMAQMLFRQWFVEEARDDWEEASLGDFVQCTTGYSYRSEDLKPSKNALVTLKNFARDGSFRMDGFKEFVGDKFKPKQIIKQGDLVVSHTDITQEADIVGNPALVIAPPQYDTLVMTMDLMKVESNQEWLSKEFLYYLFKTTQFKSHCLGYSNGSTVLHMSRKAIPNFQFRLPNRDKVVAFTDSAKPSVRKIVENIDHIRTIENLRDRLLPYLMSGRIQTSSRRGRVS